MEIILTILYSAVFIFLIYKMKFFSIDNVTKKTLSIIFILKVISGVSLVLIYVYYYKTRVSADVFKYFDDGEIVFSAIYNNPLDYLRMVTGIDADAEHLKSYYETAHFWIKDHNYELYNDNRTVIRFNAIVRLFSFGYINVHTVFMSFLSFIGLTAIFKTFYPFFKAQKTELILCVYFVPSVMLWTSGVLKEGILMFAFGLLIYTFNNLMGTSKNPDDSQNKMPQRHEVTKIHEEIFVKHRVLVSWWQKIQVIRSFLIKTIHIGATPYGVNKIKDIILLLVSFFILMISKFYILIAALPGLVSIYWLSKTNQKAPLLKFIIVHILFFIFAFNSQYIIKEYNFLEILSQKQHDFVNLVNSLTIVGSAIEIPELQPTFISLVKNIPQALVNSFFRPHIFEVHSPIVLLAAIENLIILILIILSLVLFNKNKIRNIPFLYFSISLVIIVFILGGLITPVLGALVRYKTPALPFLFISFLFLIDTEKLYKWLRCSKC